MAVFVPCPSCGRHVRSGERECPFCARSLGIQRHLPRKSVELVLVGMLGAQVGCATTKEAPIERTTVEPATSAVGAPPSAPAVTPSEPPGSAAPTDPSQGRDFAPMYGAPWSGFIPSNVCFEGPTAKIKADASGTLETMADAIKSSAVPVEVHARATAAEAKDPHTLAERRLKAAVAALVKLGAPVKRIVPMNLGAAPPSPEVDPTAPPCIDFKFQFKEHSED